MENKAILQESEVLSFAEAVINAKINSFFIINKMKNI